MSASILKQMLDFVENDESKTPKQELEKSKKLKGSKSKGPKNKQRELNLRTSLSKVNKKIKKPVQSYDKQTANEIRIKENVKKLKILSKVKLNSKIADKIIDRAVSGRPVSDKIYLNDKEDTPSVFTNEDFQKFEREYFCS